MAEVGHNYSTFSSQVIKTTLYKIYCSNRVLQSHKIDSKKLKQIFHSAFTDGKAPLLLLLMFLYIKRLNFSADTTIRFDLGEEYESEIPVIIQKAFKPAHNNDG